MNHMVLVDLKNGGCLFFILYKMWMWMVLFDPLSAHGNKTAELQRKLTASTNWNLHALRAYKKREKFADIASPELLHSEKNYRSCKNVCVRVSSGCGIQTLWFPVVPCCLLSEHHSERGVKIQIEGKYRNYFFSVSQIFCKMHLHSVWKVTPFFSFMNTRKTVWMRNFYLIIVLVLYFWHFLRLHISTHKFSLAVYLNV